MRGFVLAALGAAVVSAASREFVPGIGQNGATGQFVRLSDKTSTEILGNKDITGTLVRWTVDSWGVFYEDTGKEMIRLQFNLQADLFATDTVKFELAYRPGSMNPPTDIATIGEDYVKCDMTRSTTNTAFWSASISEGYYICKAGGTASNVCKAANIAKDDANYTPVPESKSDWATPYVDDDVNDYWCTKANKTVGATLSPYECTNLKCVVERILDTKDTVNDLKFTFNTSGEETIVV